MTRDKDPLAGSADRRLPILAGVAALCAVLLALSTNVASSLVSQEWAKHHAVWVWAATGVLALASVCLATLASRHGAPSDQTQIAGSLRVGTAAHVEVVSRGAKVDRSVHVTESSGPVVIAEPGSSVSIGSSVAQPPPEHQPGQIVVGELPGAPPAFVQREAVNRLAEAFAAAARVAVVSALTGQRGAGKTQVAAAYARQAVVDGIELVAWVSAEDLSRLRAGLAEVAHRLGVADPEGDPEKSATRLRDALAARTTPALLVLDNASDPQAVRHYLPPTGATRVIITSTDRAVAGLGLDVAVNRFERRQSLAYPSQRTSIADDPGGGRPVNCVGG